MRRRSRLLLAGIGIAVAAGIALGFTLTRGGPENALAQGPPGVLARGNFKTVTWATKGSVTIDRTASGQVTLRFSRAFDAKCAPDLFVYMGKKRFALQHAFRGQTYHLDNADASKLHATV